MFLHLNLSHSSQMVKSYISRHVQMLKWSESKNQDIVKQEKQIHYL